MSWFSHKPQPKRRKPVPHRTPGPITKQAWDKFKESAPQQKKAPEPHTAK
jgi:hypothetical protein